MPPTQCFGRSNRNSGWMYPQTGQPEEWVERGVCLPRSQRGQHALPGTSTGQAIPPSNGADRKTHTSIMSLIVRLIAKKLSIANLRRSISSKSHCTFLGPSLFFPPPRPLFSKKKNSRHKKNSKSITMTEPPPPPRSPNCAPHDVTQDSPLHIDDIRPLAHRPNNDFDDWSPADTEQIVASKCWH